MLTKDSLNAAMPLATILDDRNLILVPVPGTPLEALVNATRSDNNFNEVSQSEVNGVSVNSYVPDVVNIEFIANAKDPTLQVSKHDMCMDDLVEVVSTAVKEHMVFAKNVVAPAVEELVTKTIATLASLTPSSLLGMEVIAWYPPKPMLSSSLEDAVRTFEELAFDIPAMNLRMPSITAKEIIELMKSGSNGLDKQIDEWAATLGDTWFINLWENVFQIKQAELNERTVVTFRTFMYDREDQYDCALAIYLLSRKLVDGPLPNTEMNLNAYNKTIVEFRNQSAARLCLAFDDLNKVSKAELLVRSTSERVTVVYGSTYAKWIEAGGENEVLFGNLLSLPSVVTVPAINAKASELKALWDRHAILTATIERNRLFSRTKEVLMTHFQEQIRSITEGEEATLSNRETVIKLFGECLDTVREDELADIWNVCLKLVCHSRFNRTEARRILLGIERVKKENPHIDIREAAAISVIEYISHWISTQMKVVPAVG